MYIHVLYVWRVNKNSAEMANSTLNLMVAGTEDGILMIEGAADFLPEETLIEALRAGHEAIKTICRALR
jgi:polyribonucleotide nucleotidyltransferase